MDKELPMYAGKPLDKMSKDELIQAVIFLSSALQMVYQQNVRDAGRLATGILMEDKEKAQQPWWHL